MTTVDATAAPSYVQPIAQLFRTDCSALWATTFNLELELFNEYLLGRLGEPPLNAVIICDRVRLDQYLGDIPAERLSLLNSTNRRYLLAARASAAAGFTPSRILR